MGAESLAGVTVAGSYGLGEARGALASVAAVGLSGAAIVIVPNRAAVHCDAERGGSRLISPRAGRAGKAEDPVRVAVQEQLGGLVVELEASEVGQAVRGGPGRVVGAE